MDPCYGYVAFKRNNKGREKGERDTRKAVRGCPFRKVWWRHVRDLSLKEHLDKFISNIYLIKPTVLTSN